MKVKTLLQSFFARYGEKAVGSASWRGAYESSVPEVLKKKATEKQNKK